MTLFTTFDTCRAACAIEILGNASSTTGLGGGTVFPPSMDVQLYPVLQLENVKILTKKYKPIHEEDRGEGNK